MDTIALALTFSGIVLHYYGRDWASWGLRLALAGFALHTAFTIATYGLLEWFAQTGVLVVIYFAVRGFVDFIRPNWQVVDAIAICCDEEFPTRQHLADHLRVMHPDHAPPTDPGSPK